MDCVYRLDRLPSLRRVQWIGRCKLVWMILIAAVLLVNCALGANNYRVSFAGAAGPVNPVLESYFKPSSWFGSYTPCSYPSPFDYDFRRRCLITERAYEQHNMCNLDGAVSNTEMDGIVAQLNELFNGKRGRCICESSPPFLAPLDERRPFRRGNDSRNVHSRTAADEPRARTERGASPADSQLCWYKIAFAFVNSLPIPTLPLPPQLQRQELCNSTAARSSNDPRYPTPSPTPPPTTLSPEARRWTPKKAHIYGSKFAQIVRERWRIGQCGEDLLLLVVVRRPDYLGEAEENKTGPVIFASWGDAVKEGTAHLTIENEAALTFLLNHYNKLMADQDKTKLKYYLSGLLEEYFKALSLADQTNSKPNKIRNFAYEEASRLRSKQHIPDWALGAFGGCALLLIVMGIGYCLVKSRVRRGASRAKPGADGGRRWKAGFVGEGGGRSQSKPIKPPRKRRTKLFPVKSFKIGGYGGGPQSESARRGYGAS